MNYVLLIVGFIFLIKGADFLVDSAAKLAKLFGISAFIIGLSVVAFGTSAPETTIGVLSGIKHTNQITLGDVIGSCIANIAFILGLTSIIKPLHVEKSVIKKEIPLSFFIQVMLAVLIYIGAIISSFDGVFLLISFSGFIFYIYYSSKRNIKSSLQESVAFTNEEVAVTSSEYVEENVGIHLDNNSLKEKEALKKASKIKDIAKLLALFVLGLLGLIAGGNIVVDNAVQIAQNLGLSEALIGLTIVALGTSLPELVTTVTATIKGESEIAVGNIVGSNIFNILLVLGVSSIFNPIKVLPKYNFDVIVMILATILLFVLSYKKNILSRFSGVILILYYFSYIGFKIFSV